MAPLDLKKYKLLSLDSFANFSCIKQIFKCVNNLAPAVLRPYVTKTNGNRITTRGPADGNCKVAQCKTSLGQSSFSVKGTHFWKCEFPELKT